MKGMGGCLSSLSSASGYVSLYLWLRIIYAGHALHQLWLDWTVLPSPRLALLLFLPPFCCCICQILGIFDTLTWHLSSFRLTLDGQQLPLQDTDISHSIAMLISLLTCVVVSLSDLLSSCCRCTPPDACIPCHILRPRLLEHRPYAHVTATPWAPWPIPPQPPLGLKVVVFMLTLT